MKTGGGEKGLTMWGEELFKYIEKDHSLGVKTGTDEGNMSRGAWP